MHKHIEWQSSVGDGHEVLFAQDTSQKPTFKAKVTGEDTDLHTKWNAAQRRF